MQLTYRGLLREHDQLETTLAEGWGYSITAEQHIPVKPKIAGSKKVANIEPLRYSKPMPKSRKLQRVEEELLVMENDRKLRLLTEKARERLGEGEEEVGSAAIEMMKQRIEEYNFLVEHRHIREKNSAQARRILGLKKSQLQLVREKIDELQAKGSSSLAQTIQINQDIAQLYRQYHTALFNSKETTPALTLHPSSQRNRSHTQTSKPRTSITSKHPTQQSYLTSQNLSPAFRRTPWKETQIDSHKEDAVINIKELQIMPEMNESEEGSSVAEEVDVFDEDEAAFRAAIAAQSLIYQAPARLQRRTSEWAPRRRLVTDFSSPKEKALREKKAKMNTTIAEPFITQEANQKGERLDRMLEDHTSAMEIWKGKVADNFEKNKANYIRFKQQKIPIGRVSTRKNSMKRSPKRQVIENVPAKAESSDRSRPMHSDELRSALENKQSILCRLVEKKVSKYKRVPGTQLLQRNDVRSTVKDFLGLKHNSRSLQCNLPSSQSHKQSLMTATDDTQQPEWERMESDEKSYEMMCKNEKLNLLLRGSKRHKK